MSKKLTWLHISDIHFHHKTEWRDGSSRLELLEHLKNLYASDPLLCPSLIFCTGDIAFGESSNNALFDQYAQAKSFFDDLLAICGHGGVPLPKERLFVVPGNHDVNRSSVNSYTQNTLTMWAKDASSHVDTINQHVDDRSKEFKENINRLDEYAQFVKDYLPHQHDTNGRHHYAGIYNISGIKVGIAGFNSAWSCAGPEDDRNIWLAANWQFNAAYKVVKDAELCIGLMHHPVDWLNFADRNLANSRIASDFDFWLHGHSHNAWVTPIQSHIVISAGAIGAEDSEEFGINLTCIDLETSDGISYLYSKKAGSSGWAIAPVEPHAPIGAWPFYLPTKLSEKSNTILRTSQKMGSDKSSKSDQIIFDDVDRYLTKNLEESLQSFSSQPKVWISPILSTKSEISPDAKTASIVDLRNIIDTPKSTIIKAPPPVWSNIFGTFYY